MVPQPKVKDQGQMEEGAPWCTDSVVPIDMASQTYGGVRFVMGLPANRASH